MSCMCDAGGIPQVTVFERVRLPSLGGATGWLNSEPLGPASCAATSSSREILVARDDLETARQLCAAPGYANRREVVTR
jgi:hypothetical protein